MGGVLRDYVYAEESWPDEGSGSRPVSGESGGEEDNHLTNNQKFRMPDEIGILAIRNAVVFPGTVAPLAVGREKSRALLKDVKPNETVIGILTQHRPDTDKPGFDDLYRVGTAATVLKIIRSQGAVSIFVHGIARFGVIEPVATEPYLKARVRHLESETKMTKRLKALMVSVRQAANRVIALSPNVPDEVSAILEEIEAPAVLADYLAANVSLNTEERQKLLE